MFSLVLLKHNPITSIIYENSSIYITESLSISRERLYFLTVMNWLKIDNFRNIKSLSWKSMKRKSKKCRSETTKAMGHSGVPCFRVRDFAKQWPHLLNNDRTILFAQTPTILFTNHRIDWNKVQKLFRWPFILMHIHCIYTRNMYQTVAISWNARINIYT